MAGFYKVVNGRLENAPNSVNAPGYTLVLKDKATYTYPHDGWSYFDTDDAAYVFFGAAIDRTKNILNEINSITTNDSVQKKLSELSTVLGKGALTKIN